MHSHRGSACKSPGPLPEQLPERPGKVVLPPTSWEGGGGACRDTLTFEELLGGSRDSEPACMRTAKMGHSVQWGRTGDPCTGCLMPPPSCEGLESLLLRGQRQNHDISPKASSLEAWPRAGGWSHGILCPHPPQCQHPEAGLMFSMNPMAWADSVCAGGRP